MTDLIQTASQDLLFSSGLNQNQVESLVQDLVKNNIDYADLFFQSTYSESWALEDRLIKGGSYDIDRGVGVRVLSGEKTGFSYIDDIELTLLEQAANTAHEIIHTGKNTPSRPIKWHQTAQHNLYLPFNPLKEWNEQNKVDLLRQIDAYVRAQDHRIQQVNVSLAGEYEMVLIICSDGTVAADVRPLVRFNVSVLVEEQGRRESGYAGGGGRFSYDYFLNEETAFRLADEALRQALVNLSAKPAPAGSMPVVLGAGWPGVLLHEAVGHGLEGDFNRKGISAYSGRMGTVVASPLCTVVDHGALANRRGSLNVDDEGTPTQETILIENGILKGYLFDKHNARLMNTHSTGNGRRESYAHLPMPRMTNTYLKAGTTPVEDIIASVDRGIYAVNFGGGQVDITSGKFVFSANEAYLIERGKITSPIKGATLIGNGPDVLTQVSMVGNDWKLDSGVGICGKDGQSVPVGVGQPTLKIDMLTVGGTES